MRRIKKLERIDKAIDRVLRICGIEEAVLENTVLSLLPKILDEKINSHITGFNIENRILFIKLDSPVWANQLLFLKKDLIEKINKNLPKKFVKNIIFKS